MVRNSVPVRMTLFSNFGSTKGAISLGPPQRADPYSSSRLYFFGLFAFEVDQQAEAHRAHNADEPIEWIKPRREVGKGRAHRLPQAHELMGQIRALGQPVAVPSFRQAQPMNRYGMFGMRYFLMLSILMRRLPCTFFFVGRLAGQQIGGSLSCSRIGAFVDFVRFSRRLEYSEKQAVIASACPDLKNSRCLSGATL